MAERFNVNEILEMEMASMSIDIKTGYTCKECNDVIVGHYVFIKTEMYFQCKCKCSNWLVKSKYLNKTFNKQSSVFLV